MKYQTSWECCFKTKATRFIWKKKVSQDKILGVTNPKLKIPSKVFHRTFDIDCSSECGLQVSIFSAFCLSSQPHLIPFSLYCSSLKGLFFSVGPWIHQALSNNNVVYSPQSFLQMLFSVLLHSHPCSALTAMELIPQILWILVCTSFFSEAFSYQHCPWTPLVRSP